MYPILPPHSVSLARPQVFLGERLPYHAVWRQNDICTREIRNIGMQNTAEVTESREVYLIIQANC